MTQKRFSMSGSRPSTAEGRGSKIEWLGVACKLGSPWRGGGAGGQSVGGVSLEIIGELEKIKTAAENYLRFPIRKKDQKQKCRVHSPSKWQNSCKYCTHIYSTCTP
jgi:hypothetical protein